MTDTTLNGETLIEENRRLLFALVKFPAEIEGLKNENAILTAELDEAGNSITRLVDERNEEHDKVEQLTIERDQAQAEVERLKAENTRLITEHAKLLECLWEYRDHADAQRW